MIDLIVCITVGPNSGKGVGGKMESSLDTMTALIETVQSVSHMVSKGAFDTKSYDMIIFPGTIRTG